jgi:hypothetical protein
MGMSGIHGVWTSSIVAHQLQERPCSAQNIVARV